MQILWRGDEYEFTPRRLDGGKDRPSIHCNINAPIFAADTESVQLTDRYEPQCFTLSDPSGREFLKYIPENAFALQTFLQFFLGQYGHVLLEESHVFMYFHNLEYDWNQLIKTDKRLLEMVRIGVGPDADIKLMRIGSFYVTLKKGALFTGSAPHFTLRITAGEKGFNLHFRDSFSFFPSSLARVAKDLKLNASKMERQEDIGLVDFRTVIDSDPDKQYFEKYAKIDATVTRLAGERIRELHKSADMLKIRASAPGYAIGLLFHMMTPEQHIISGDRDESVMQLIFDTYRGGRTGGIYHGRIDSVSVLDFHSSYPASMLSLPSFNSNMVYAKIDDLRLDNIIAILEETGNAFLRVSGREEDCHYPALITTHNSKLTPIFGEFENVATTGVELLVGIKSGTLHISEIHECIVLLDMDDDPFLPFKEFALGAYKRKAESEKGSTEYASAKLALNSAYGKLIESRTQTLVGASDFWTHFPYIATMEKEFGNYYYQKYLDAIEEGLTLDDVYEDILLEVYDAFPSDVPMLEKMFGEFSISGRIYGRNVVPAAASLITATSRARLCAVMKALHALYWDTDSVFIQGLSPEEIGDRLRIATGWLPQNVVPLRIGEELGELDCEIENASGYLAGTKRYYLETGDDKIKAAIHGIPAMPRDKYKDVISFLATGSNYDYMSKPKPMKAKESKSVSDIGSFQSKKYQSVFHLDERLEWERISGGWAGTIRPFHTMEKKEIGKHVEKMAQDLFRNHRGSGENSRNGNEAAAAREDD